MAVAGINPLKQSAKAVTAPTFQEVAQAVMERKKQELSNAKSIAQWETSLTGETVRSLSTMPVDTIEVEDVLGVLQPIWQIKHETASRIRGRLEAVFDHAIALKHRTPPNPAAWKGNLKNLLPNKAPYAARHQPALQLADAPRWWRELKQRDGMGTKALMFLTLTACRSGEVRGMKWSELNGPLSRDEPLEWVIEASRMKARRQHRVPLTEEMKSLLRSLPQDSKTDLVFPSTTGTELSDMTLSATMKRMHVADCKDSGSGFIDATSKKPAVPHGIRSTFRDWAAEKGYENDMAEIQLAHEVGNAVTRAYRRTAMVERRRKMMADWGNFLEGR